MENMNTTVEKMQQTFDGYKQCLNEVTQSIHDCVVLVEKTSKSLEEEYRDRFDLEAMKKLIVLRQDFLTISQDLAARYETFTKSPTEGARQ